MFGVILYMIIRNWGEKCLFARLVHLCFPWNYSPSGCTKTMSSWVKISNIFKYCANNWHQVNSLRWCEFTEHQHFWWVECCQICALFHFKHHFTKKGNLWHNLVDTVEFVYSTLTKLIKVRIAAIGSWDWADQSSLEECCPLVHQTSLTTHVILIQDKTVESNSF